MTKIKKITAVLLSLVMAVAAFAVSASAIDLFPDAKTAKSGKEVEVTMSSGSTKTYKFNVSQKGKIEIKIVHTSSQYVTFSLKDSDGGKIGSSTNEAKAGFWSGNSAYPRDGKFSGSVEYTVTKGTYFLEVYSSSGGLVSFTPKYPSKTEKSISSLTVTLKNGTTLQLGAILSDGKNCTAEWSSSDKSVATVSSTGKVTAKNKGTATITAKLGSSKASIVIQVS